MGRKLDALLGRNFKTSKFKTLTKLAISRTSILSNQHHIRMSQARSDVKELLRLSQQDRAMLRVEHVIKEQNMVDVFSMVEFYCHLLVERVKLLGQSKECPEELKEATSSLIYAASRCGEFPELQKIREVLTSRFGKEFAARAVELRNNCGVNSKMIQKFSTRRPSFASRSKVLKEIASECGLTLHLEEDAPLSNKEEKPDVNQKQEENEPAKAVNSDNNALVHNTPLFRDIEELERFSESMKAKRKYTDVAAAAQEAFESAAYAAAAARAAVELSMTKSMDKDHHEDHDDSDSQEGIVLDFDIFSKSKTVMIANSPASEETKHLDNRLSFETVHPADDLTSGSEGKEDMADGRCDIHLQEEAEKEKESLVKKLSDLNLGTDHKDERLSNASNHDNLSHEDSTKLSFKSAKSDHV